MDLSAVKRSAEAEPESEPAPEPEPDDPDPDPTARLGAPIIPRAKLIEHGDTYVEEAGARVFPTRPQGPELDIEIGDEVVFVTLDPKLPEGKPCFEALLCRVEAFEGEQFAVAIVCAIDKHKLYPPKMDHGYAQGNWLLLARDHVALVIKPEPPAVMQAKSRRKRYKVGSGDLIELLPERLPEDPIWASSRPDVEVHVVSEEEGRAVVALEGGSGDVNVALMSAGTNGTPRPLMSWKFKLLAGTR